MSAYTTKSKIEDYLALTIDDSLNDSITSWITAVSDWIDLYCNRSFEPKTTAEVKKYDGNDTEWLDIDDAIEITKVEIDGTEVPSDGYTTYPANKLPITRLRLNQTTAPNSRMQVYNNNYTWQSYYPQGISVTGKFCYSATVPPMIELAATKMVGAIIKEAVGDGDVKEVTQESIGRYSVGYARIGEIANQMGVKEELAPYIKPSTTPRVTTIQVS